MLAEGVSEQNRKHEDMKRIFFQGFCSYSEGNEGRKMEGTGNWNTMEVFFCDITIIRNT